MRDRREIEREMYRAREDLEASLGELKHVVQEKIDVKARVEHAIDERVDAVKDAVKEKVVAVKDMARDLTDRGKHVLYRGRDGAVAMYYKGRYKAGRAYDASRDYTQENPVLVSAVLGGVLLLTVGAIFLLRRRRRQLF